MGAGFGYGRFTGTKGGRIIQYPGNNSAISPGPGFQWKGKSAPGNGPGSWYNPTTHESWYPDLKHTFPIGPHWDYRDGEGKEYRVYPDGRVEPK